MEPRPLPVTPSSFLTLLPGAWPPGPSSHGKAHSCRSDPTHQLGQAVPSPASPHFTASCHGHLFASHLAAFPGLADSIPGCPCLGTLGSSAASQQERRQVKEAHPRLRPPGWEGPSASPQCLSTGAPGQEVRRTRHGSSIPAGWQRGHVTDQGSLTATRPLLPPKCSPLGSDWPSPRTQAVTWAFLAPGQHCGPKPSWGWPGPRTSHWLYLAVASWGTVKIPSSLSGRVSIP